MVECKKQVDMNDDSQLSINRMMEMAMGFSMASLFHKAMESAYTNKAFQFNNDAINTPAKYLYAIINGQQAGPFSPGELMDQIRSGNVSPETYMWKPGMGEWKMAKDIGDIAPGVNLVPPAMPKNETL